MVNIILAKMALCQKNKTALYQIYLKEIENYCNRILTLFELLI